MKRWQPQASAGEKAAAYAREVPARPIAIAIKEPAPDKPKFWFECVQCPDQAKVIYKGTTFCRRCGDEFRRTEHY